MSETEMSNLEVKSNLLIKTLLIAGGINWGTTALGYNVVAGLSRGINRLFKRNLYIDKIAYLLVGISAIILAYDKTFWFPFTGKARMPGAFFTFKTPGNSDNVIKIHTQPNSKIAYWATTGTSEKQTREMAYGDFSNSGVVMSDANGVAELPIKTGSGFTVPGGYVVKRNVSYRVIGDRLMSKVYEVKY